MILLLDNIIVIPDEIEGNINTQTKVWIISDHFTRKHDKKE